MLAYDVSRKGERVEEIPDLLKLGAIFLALGAVFSILLKYSFEEEEEEEEVSPNPAVSKESTNAVRSPLGTESGTAADPPMPVEASSEPLEPRPETLEELVRGYVRDSPDDERADRLEKIATHPDRESAVSLFLSEYEVADADTGLFSDLPRGRVCKGLASLNTDEALQGLYEIYARKRRVPPGSEGFFDEDEAHLAAWSIVHSSIDFRELSRRFGEEQAAELFVRSHTYQHEDEGVIQVLAEIGSEQSIECLIYNLRDASWKCGYHDNLEEFLSNQPAVDALKTTGPQAIAQLSRKLTLKFDDPKRQAFYRHWIVEVLATIGDATCVEDLQALARTDRMVAQDATEALAAIAKRCDLKSELPELQAHSDAHAVPRMDPTGDALVDACFRVAPDELEEERDWSRIDELKRVPELVEMGARDEALRILRANEDRYRDFFFIYTWQAQILFESHSVDEALGILDQGITASRRKFPLYTKLAEVHFERGDVAKAVMWWIRSVLSQRAVGVHSYTPYVYLAGSAAGLGMDAEAEELKAASRTDVTLSPDARQRLSIALARGTMDEQMSLTKALQILCGLR